MSWIPFSLIATLCFGISTALYKLPAAKGHSRFATVFWFLVAAAVLAIVFFYPSLTPPSWEIVVLGIMWSLTFVVLTSLQMYALGHVDTNTLFPATSTLSLAAVVLIGLGFFDDHVSLWQGLGIVLAVTTVYLFTHKKGRPKFSALVVWLGIFIVTLSASNKIIQKLGAEEGDIRNFQIYAYLAGILFALISHALLTKRSQFRRDLFSRAMPWGLLNGAFAFFGGWAILIALGKGPFSLVFSMHSLYVAVTALVGYFVFKEKLGVKKWSLIFLSIAAVLLMALG